MAPTLFPNHDDKRQAETWLHCLRLFSQRHLGALFNELAWEGEKGFFMVKRSGLVFHKE